jgi:hypothetical protein
LDEKGEVFGFPPKEKQKEALKFIQEQLFKTPTWLYQKQLYSLTGVGTSYDLLAVQKQMLEKLISNALLGQFEFSTFYQGKESYSVDEMLTDLEAGIWKELQKHTFIDEYRRNLQKAFVMQMVNVLNPGQEVLQTSYGEYQYLPWGKRTDVHAVVKGHLRDLLKKINSVLPYYTDNVTRFHLMDVKDKILAELGSEKRPQVDNQARENTINFNRQTQDQFIPGISVDVQYKKWDNCVMWSAPSHGSLIIQETNK